MPTHRHVVPGILLALLLTTVLASPALAEGKKKAETASSDSQALYSQGKQASDSGDYVTALGLFEKANALEADNPDILNMLAYTQRKTGKIDEALVNYHRALELRPEFPEAREYLGEAYIQAALREIKTLKGYGAKGAHEHEELVEAFKDAAAGL